MTYVDPKDSTIEILKRPVFIDRHGVAALVTGQATFYFSELQGNEERLIEAYRYVKPMISEHVVWYQTEALPGPRQVKPQTIDAFEVWFEQDSILRNSYQMVMGSGAGIGEIGPWGFRFGVVNNTLPHIMGYFQFNIPAQELIKNASHYRSILCNVFDAMPWVSGHAGFGVLYDLGYVNPMRDAAIRATCMRYIGIDCCDVITETEALTNTIKGVDWITFLGSNLARSIKNEAKNNTNILIESIGENGLLIQAGELPLLCDKNRSENISPYIYASELLRPLRVHELFPLPGFADESDTNQWLERFDNM